MISGNMRRAPWKDERNGLFSLRNSLGRTGEMGLFFSISKCSRLANSLGIFLD